ncbi:MAG: hypothetical protein J6L64_04670 [Opitutales bacterium]|nr:hypothetical protein [Opitutales bacterium]
MQKLALPAIFISAVAATLFYVSQEEHGTGTLVLLASVLLVGQICATLPFIFDAKNPRAGTSQNPSGSDTGTQKIVANQQIIHEDLRSLGETLIKRLNAISERQENIEKKFLAALAKTKPDLSDDFDAFREKLFKNLEEHFEELDEKIGEPEPDEDAHKKLDAISERLEDFLVALENLAPGEIDDENENSENFDVPEIDEEEAPAEEKSSDDDCEFVEDFPEDTAEISSGEIPEEAEDAPAKQSEFELGDFPQAHAATLILEAMLGIGNKPLLRGNAPGLSEHAGTPMTFVEIGKWSYDFDSLTEEITVRILRNDNESEPLGESVTLAPGQTLELAYVPEHT